MRGCETKQNTKKIKPPKDTPNASAGSMQRINNTLIAATIELPLTKGGRNGGNPVFLLVQHAACHWCFLMARDLPHLLGLH